MANCNFDPTAGSTFTADSTTSGHLDELRQGAANATAHQNSDWMECGLTLALPSQNIGKSETLMVVFLRET